MMDLARQLITGLPAALLDGAGQLISVAAPFGVELGIESEQSQQFSVGIFYFLILGIVVFAIISFAFMFKDKTKSMKKGEKILFAWIMLGLVVAVLFGTSQLLQGYLF